LADPMQTTACVDDGYQWTQTIRRDHALPLTEGEVYLIMHLWELYPGLGHQLSEAVRTFRGWDMRPAHLARNTWSEMCGGEIAAFLAHIILETIRTFQRITAELEHELAVTAHRAC
jgi:hypothetical protein